MLVLLFYRVFPDMEILLTKISPSVNLRNCWNSFEKEKDILCEHWILEIKVDYFFEKYFILRKIFWSIKY